jgi:transglutaminase-like putative cysteine protease
MYWKTSIPAMGVVCLLLAGCGTSRNETEAVPNVVTQDIQDAIEKYIEDQSKANGGYFNLAHGDQELRLKLVRVHTEYLANLGPRRHFACVDLVDVGSDVYDVDFFLSGDPGAMTVTETTVHKINGQPYYAWEQKKDGGWQRIPVENASEGLLGVVQDRDSFEFLYKVILPEITHEARIWIPKPASDRYQTVDVASADFLRQPSILQDREHGNSIYFLELGPEDSERTLEILFHVDRREKSNYNAQIDDDPGKYLKPERLVPMNENFRAIASEVVQGKKSDIERARALYDHAIEQMRYMKYGKGWGKGDAVYACDARTGNCTDFHSYFIALARAVGIPARFAIGASIPSERNQGGIDGYHCWAEFYADGQWWPSDISEADKYTSLATYYFGHHPANRIELSRGRDLLVEPSPASGLINFLAYPVLEIAGNPIKVQVEFSFKRIGPGNS